MSRCVYCGARKGKRPCPALNGSLCSQCCGTHRLVSIPCHTDCAYLDNNVAYQQKRVGDQFEQQRRALYKELLEQWGEKAVEVLYFLEAVTFKHFHARKDAQDGEVIAAIQTLRRSFSPIHIPEGIAPPFTESLKKEFQAFMQGEKADTQLVNAVLDRGVTFMTGFSGTGLRSNRFLNGLIGFLKSRYPETAEQLATLGKTGGQILLPGGTSPQDRGAPFHPGSHG